MNHARRFAGGQPVLCMLGDAIFSGPKLPAAELIAAHEKLQTTVIGLEEVPLEKTERYGIVSGPMIEEGIVRIESVVEKPARGTTQSRLAIAGRYLLTPEIYDCLDHTPPGGGGEIQLTDALRRLLKHEPVHGIVLSARRHDIGELADWLATNLIFAAGDINLWRKLAPLVQSLLDNGKHR
jgi:UTP--glucose-1-phosphate uridylyltransferase